MIQRLFASLDVNQVHLPLLDAFVRYRGALENLQRVREEQYVQDDQFFAESEKRSAQGYHVAMELLQRPRSSDDPHGIRRTKEFITALEQQSRAHSALSSSYKAKRGPSEVEAELATQAVRDTVSLFSSL
jgi:hypothetical protein